MKNDYETFISNFKKNQGLIFFYKEAQMKRRLTSLRDKRGYHDFSSYFTDVQKDAELFHELLDRLTINVSEFYRNKKRWDVLEEKVIPHLKKTRNRIKVWSAACSTGEEPYTLAMILNKHISSNKFEITATDIDENALRRAEMGVYPERSLREAPKEMVHKYFKKQGLHYQVSDELKKDIIFKKHNLLSDRFEQNYDLIVCRNVLIYFTEQAKQQIYHKFSQSLTENGIFFVGSTEQVFTPGEYNLKVFDTFFYEKNA